MGEILTSFGKKYFFLLIFDIFHEKIDSFCAFYLYFSIDFFVLLC